MRSLLIGLLLFGPLVYVGCDFATEPPDPVQYRPASSVVINEVFTLPFTHPNFYSWIEFLNPTQDTVDLNGWTLTQTCFRLTNTEFWLTVRIDDSTSDRTLLGSQNFVPDGLGVYDVPFSEGHLTLLPGGLLTIVSNEGRLQDHTDWGPGDTRLELERPILAGPVSDIDTVLVQGDSTYTTEISYSYAFFILPTEQLVLKNAAGQVVDVVRFGNYQYAGPGADPYPGNQSLGLIPEFESLARYAGGYFTGNTANDFFVTSTDVRPIPQWYSQLYRR